jgi:hypothetical protein
MFKTKLQALKDQKEQEIANLNYIISSLKRENEKQRESIQSLHIHFHKSTNALIDSEKAKLSKEILNSIVSKVSPEIDYIEQLTEFSVKTAESLLKRLVANDN